MPEGACCTGKPPSEKRVCFFQIRLVHPSPLPDGAVIVLWQLDGRDVVVRTGKPPSGVLYFTHEVSKSSTCADNYSCTY